MVATREQILAAFASAGGRARSLATRALAVEPMDDAGIFMAAVDGDGLWALAIKSPLSVRRVPAVRLATLNVEYGVKCQLDFDGQVRSVRISLVQCRTGDPEIRDLFSTFVEALLSELPGDPTEQMVADVVERWVSLFWRLQGAPRTNVIGLIGELVVLEAGINTRVWAAAWHNSPTDAIDFGFANPHLEVEVKATTGRERVHTLTVHQSNSSDVERYFASLMVELRDTGATVGDLARGISDQLPASDERRRFWGKIADVCGQQIGEYLSTRFVRETSMNSLAFYAAGAVPTPVVALPLPQGVGDLRFRSDFSSASPVDAKKILMRTS